MAPSAVETVTITQLPTLKLHSGLGDYKELLPVSYDKDAEEGKNGVAGAKVSASSTWGESARA